MVFLSLMTGCQAGSEQLLADLRLLGCKHETFQPHFVRMMDVLTVRGSVGYLSGLFELGELLEDSVKIC